MIEARLYRAAFIPAALALVVAMFSLEAPPPAIPQGLAADVLFEGRFARTTAARLVEAHPDRRPGTRGDWATAATVADALAGRGFDVSRDRFRAGGEDLVNVVARRPGASGRQVVVVAARDADSVPDATRSGADTAALLELGRVFGGRASNETLVLASVDGGTLGEAGARRLAGRLGDPELVDAVIVISNLGAPRSRGSLLVPWSSDASRESIGLERTAADSLREELGGSPGRERASGQAVRLAFPLGIGAQAHLLARGFDALRVSGSGELPPAEDRVADIDQDRYGALGRAVLRTISAVEAGGSPEHGPETYLRVAGQVEPGWAVSMLSLALILPALVAAIDAFARARRRREAVGRWSGWLLAGTLPFVLWLVAAQALDLIGGTQGAPDAAFPPGERPLDAEGAAALAVTLAVFMAGWLVARRTLIREAGPLPRPSAPGAGCATALVLSLAVVALWALNPFAALLLVPSLHLWILASGTGLRPAVGLVLALGGLVLPLGAALFYLERLALDPLEGVWYGFLLVAGRGIGLGSSLLACVILGVFASVVAILAARARDGDGASPRPTVLGPGGHAGPGALGGTSSALRRR